MGLPYDWHMTAWTYALLCKGSLFFMLALLAGTLYMASAIVIKQLTAISKVTFEVAMREDV